MKKLVLAVTGTTALAVAGVTGIVLVGKEFLKEIKVSQGHQPLYFCHFFTISNKRKTNKNQEEIKVTRTQIVEMMVQLDRLLERAEDYKIIERLEKQKEALKLQLGQ